MGEETKGREEKREGEDKAEERSNNVRGGLLRYYRDDYRADLILHVHMRLALTRRNGGRKNKDTHRGRITSYRIGYGQVHVLLSLLFLCQLFLPVVPFDCRVLHD